MILPNVSPGVCLLLTFCSFVFILSKTDMFISSKPFGLKVALTNLVVYLFAFHAHEKAILPSLILISLNLYPIKLTQVKAYQSLHELYLFLFTLSGFSIIPILRPGEFSLKVYSFYFLSLFASKKYADEVLPKQFMEKKNRFLIFSICFLIFLNELIFPNFLKKYEFLPKLTVSLFCSVNFVYFTKLFFDWFRRY